MKQEIKIVELDNNVVYLKLDCPVDDHGVIAYNYIFEDGRLREMTETHVVERTLAIRPKNQSLDKWEHRIQDNIKEK